MTDVEIAPDSSPDPAEPAVPDEVETPAADPVEPVAPVDPVEAVPVPPEELEESDPVGCEWGASFPYAATGVDIDVALPTGYEPSGAAWHSRLQKVFVVSDDGILSMMDADGTDVTNWTPGGDLEGVAVADPDTDFIYVGVEDPDGIIEFNFVTGTVTRTFTLTPWMTGAANSGLEALAFVNDAASAEGGSFYAGHQGEGKIYVFSLPIATSASSTSVTFVHSFTPVASRTDIAGLDYDAATDTLFILYDAADKILLTDADGASLAEWTAPGVDQEGFTVLSDCEIVIAQDTGGVMLYE